MMPHLRAFLAGDRGTVAVDWTLVSALSIAMTLSAMAVIADGSEASGTDISGTLTGLPAAHGFD